MFKEIKLGKELEKIKEVALKRFPNEMCGFLMPDGFIETLNVSDTPESSFRIDPMEVQLYIKDALAVVHSHCATYLAYRADDIRTPSLADRKVQQNVNLPYLICGVVGNRFVEPIQYPRVPNKQYVERPFIWTINDCYTLIQDFYRFEYDITLPDGIYDFDLSNFMRLNDVFEEHIEKFGFKASICHNPINGDILLSHHLTFKNCHLGVFKDGKVLHQTEVSRWESFEYFLGRYSRVLRYVG